ncbi:MAG: NTP transferase domain-containing protein [bacterium]|nr:NTP transferase domain-containing protein [bacterium]
MKGVILAGGFGTRLMPSTKVTNKHLLPVYNKPMIYYPLNTLKNAGIKKIMIITGNDSAGDFMKLLGSGSELGVDITYKIQDGAGGIAQALALTEDFVNKEKFAIILGDNIFEDDIKKAADSFEKDSIGASLFLKEVPDPARFGVADIEGDKITSIEEKPKNPKTNLAVTGLYMYDGSTVFDIIKNLKPSDRGELEITDVNNEYLTRNSLKYAKLSGFWSDAGTFPSLYRAAAFAHEKEEKA